MFRRNVTRMGLPAIAGLSLLLAGGPAKADPQGWPVAGNWGSPSSSGGSSFRIYSPSYDATSPSTFGSSYYATYPTWSPQPGVYYSFGSRPNYYRSSPTQGYYGSTGSGDYSYGALTPESPRTLPVHVNLRVPSDSKVWFDGNQTNQTGMTRSFQSPPVATGREYAYQIRVQWKQDGKDITQTREIKVHAGDVINLTLGSAAESALAR